MLSPHNLLVAAIFIPYMIMMGTLFAYICWTGREQSGRDQDDADDEAEPRSLPLAA